MLLVSGVGFAQQWADAARHNVEVVNVLARPPGGAVEPRSDVIVSVPRMRPRRVFQRADTTVSAALVARRLGRLQNPPDVVHGHFFTAAGVPSIARRLRAAAVLTEHSTRMTGRSAAHKPLTAQGLAMARRVYSGCDRVIAVSTYLADCIRERVPGTDPVVVPNPVDTDFFTPRDVVRDGPPTLVSVGRIEADKRPLLQLDVVDHLRRALPDVRLRMVGAGPMSALVASEIRSRGLAEHVEMVGRVARTGVRDALRDADVFLHTATVETFCIAAAEALACGLPVVTSRLPAMAGFMDDAVGLIVDRDAPVEHFAEAVMELLADRDRFSDETLHDRIRAYCSPPVVGAEMARHYGDLV